MWCEINDENVTDKDCKECEENGCENWLKHHKGDDSYLVLKDSQFYKQISSKMKDVFNLGEEAIEEIAVNAYNGALATSKRTVETALENYVEAKTKTMIFDKIQAALDKTFDNLLESQVILLEKDDKIVTGKINEMILNKTKAFFMQKGEWRNNDIQKKLEEIMSKSIENKVSEALAEIKAESIDKFNKEAMKKLMQGMAKAIRDDKRLLSLMTGEE